MKKFVLLMMLVVSISLPLSMADLLTNQLAVEVGPGPSVSPLHMAVEVSPGPSIMQFAFDAGLEPDRADNKA